MTHELDARTELRDALRRMRQLLADLLARQRDGGREPSGDPLRGVAIGHGEAEGLLAELAADLDRPLPSDDGAAEPLTQACRTINETPLQRASRVFRLGALEFDAMVLCLAVELDSRFARLVAYLNDHVARTRPTVGLVLMLAASPVGAVEFGERPAFRRQLLQLEGDGPLSGQALRVAPELLARLCVADAEPRPMAGVRLRERAGATLDELVIGSAQRELLHRWASELDAGPVPAPLLLAGPGGSGRATVAQAAAEASGRMLVELAWTPDQMQRLDLAAREALWHDAVLLVRVPDAAREAELSALWAALQVWQLPVALAVTPEALERACASAFTTPDVLHLEAPTIEQREALWHRLLKSDHANGRGHALSETQVADLAARYDFRPGLLARAVRRAAAQDRAQQGPRLLDFESLARACRVVGTAGMGVIAQRLSLPYTRDDLVLSAELLAELDLASAWMLNRQRVFERWGFGRRIALGRGMTALFAGDPGTGKTMAAQVLARELGLDLFRVDLSRVMSKYIGETEKNLSQLFDEATASGAILFFDEADALFGKRSEVKDAHDRYANLEISYLLQRIEEHEGVSVLATNRMSDLDDAFTRRFHFILDFPMPRAPERRRIWEGMLPREAERDSGMALDLLANDYEMSGGEIRNSVLSAAFIASAEGAPIGMRHLKRGLHRELLKTGRVLDSRQRRALEE